MPSNKDIYNKRPEGENPSGLFYSLVISNNSLVKWIPGYKGIDCPRNEEHVDRNGQYML